MLNEELESRLSQISTAWKVIQEAHQGTPDAASVAQQFLLGRYSGAVRRYLGAVLQDEFAAEELTQEFALSLLRGEFRGAAPEKGRFRNYVKAVLFHLVGKYRKHQRKTPGPLAADSPVWSSLESSAPNEDARFNEHWRDQLLARSWEALRRSRPASYAILRFRTEHPDMKSPRMAEQFARQEGKPFSADGVRQSLRRARNEFADLLLDEVAYSLKTTTTEALVEELQELDLLEYCRAALERHGWKP